MAENLRPCAAIRPPPRCPGAGVPPPLPHHAGMRATALSSSRHGFTFVEILAALALVGIVTSIAFVPLTRAVDRASVRSASDELMTALAIARQVAIMRASQVTATLDTVAGTITIECEGDTTYRRPVESLYGVTLAATRPTVRFSANGVGYGVSNLRVIARRRSAADTIYVSRAGRARRP